MAFVNGENRVAGIPKLAPRIMPKIMPKVI
jgi:4-hydroxy-3-methylbut-2-enyl diphosphate reductase